ncbi:hypothetical protein M427DRAFT_51132 [Gonapodya prolifera JEL478]|uniref:Uncharacterized protein n=1 Tax=Gonapodya prolifera (strain JEL478) TaxID=1344416 RepID=A0A139AYC5_GONPJ|nr:hypothetical protein M427DRAFT_51132 [Gonapodya prolifera JEL478]|eukprot:KXS21751.1 hypothetical protein M427DRAFT_51132 [Gonapodya prolifera JEL478]
MATSATTTAPVFALVPALATTTTGAPTPLVLLGTLTPSPTFALIASCALSNWALVVLG